MSKSVTPILTKVRRRLMMSESFEREPAAECVCVQIKSGHNFAFCDDDDGDGADDEALNSEDADNYIGQVLNERRAARNGG